MTVGSPWKLIAGFALPVLLSQIFQQLYNTADSLIVGRFLGDEALAAVSSSGPLIFLMTSFFEGLTLGAGVAISRYFGAGDDARVERSHPRKYFREPSERHFPHHLRRSADAYHPSLDGHRPRGPAGRPISYFRYYFTGVLAVMLYNACKSVMNALGDSKRPLYYLLLSSAVNIALDILFIGGFGWGVWSAAVATVISQAISMILCLIQLSRKTAKYRLRLSHLRADREMIGLILRYGLPSGVQNSVIGLANVVVQTNINSFGKIAMAAYGTYSKLEGFAFLPITSFTMALTTYTSQNLGAQKYDRAKTGARFGIVSALLLAELIGIAMYLTMPQLASLFSRTPEVIALATRQARVITLFYCLLAYSHAVASVCRGAGKAFVPMLVMLAVWCVLRITYISLIMRYSHEIRFIYYAYPITWSISSVIFFYLLPLLRLGPRLRRSGKRKIPS